MKKIQILLSIASLYICSCNTNHKTETKLQNVSQQIHSTDFSGYYVSEFYSKKSEGYDWFAISIRNLTDSTIAIKIRSRIDKKKPTCTFDASAIKISSNQFMSRINEQNIIYTFNDTMIEISTASEKDKDILKFYCNGGGSFAGCFKKLNEPIDEKQIDQRTFFKTLLMNDYEFEVSAKGEGSIQQLNIKAYGETIKNKELNLEIDGSVTNAEIEDLNSDGLPELLIYTTSAGSGSYGNVIAYTIKNNKLNSIYFPSVSENTKINNGYMGHDMFAIVETTLVQRFKIFTENNSNSNNKIRQIQYKLVEESKVPKFKIYNVIEIPTQ